MEAPLPRERAMAMQDVFGILNARFFAGKSFLNAADTVHSEVYMDLVATDYGFLSSYARSIIEDPSPENNELDINF